MAEEQSVSSLPVKPKRKKFLPVTMSIMILCIAWYWWWNRIVSDVKIFSPPEWVWLEGKTELMIIPGRDELLIHRSKHRAPLKFTEPVDIAQEKMLNRARRKRERKYYEQLNAIRRRSEIQTGSTIKSDYYYQYDAKINKIIEVDSSVWDTNHGYITSCHKSYSYGLMRLKYKNITDIDYVKNIIKIKTKGAIIRRLLSPFVLECSRKSFEQPGDTRTVYQQCVDGFLGNGINPSATSLAMIVSAKQNVQEFRFPIMFGGSARDRSSSRQHYHQLLSLEKMSWIGDPVRIPFVTKMNGATPKVGKDLLTGVGWSYDERFVVYTGKVSFCIVEIDKQRNQK